MAIIRQMERKFLFGNKRDKQDVEPNNLQSHTFKKKAL